MKSLTETLRELETKLQAPAFRKDANAVASLLTDDFREFGSSGSVLLKQDVLRLLQNEPPIHCTMSDFQALLLSDDIALVTYRASINGIASLRSSIWVLQGEGWRLMFHQGTRATLDPEDEA